MQGRAGLPAGAPGMPIGLVTTEERQNKLLLVSTEVREGDLVDPKHH